MRFGSVCSGIEAASVAWEPLGWEPAWFSEIEPFPCAVLAHRFPNVPNLGDMRTIPERILSGEIEAPDLLCGGTPCQAFSLAGQRDGLNDDRGNLSLVFVRIIDAIDTVRTAAGLPPAIIFWENVPGVLSDAGNAFGHLLAAIAGEKSALEVDGGKWGNAGVVLGKRKIAWRILNSKFFGVPQLRRRVYLVASGGNGIDPSKILFEHESVPGDSAQGKQVRQPIAGTLQDCSGEWQFRIFENHANANRTREVTIFPTLTARMGTGGGNVPLVLTKQKGSAVGKVRRLMPVECERLQGFPDGWTQIPFNGKPAEQCSDYLRYKAIGNSWTVPVVRWIGERIDSEANGKK